MEGDGLTGQDACGYRPVVTLIELAKRKGWKARLLDYRNSGDTAGDKASVVGYAAIAFFGPTGEHAGGRAPQFTREERRHLLELARKSDNGRGQRPRGPAGGRRACRRSSASAGRVSSRLPRTADLRGCIGSLLPQEPLYQAVIRRARAAAIEDPRFSPVQPDELKQIQIEISVLTVPQPLKFASPQDLLAKLRPGDRRRGAARGRPQRHLSAASLGATARTSRMFMNELAGKAGLAADAWRQPGAEVLTYQVEAFKEKAEGEGGRWEEEK